MAQKPNENQQYPFMMQLTFYQPVLPEEKERICRLLEQLHKMWLYHSIAIGCCGCLRCSLAVNLN